MKSLLATWASPLLTIQMYINHLATRNILNETKEKRTKRKIRLLYTKTDDSYRTVRLL